MRLYEVCICFFQVDIFGLHFFQPIFILIQRFPGKRPFGSEGFSTCGRGIQWILDFSGLYWLKKTFLIRFQDHIKRGALAGGKWDVTLAPPSILSPEMPYLVHVRQISISLRMQKILLLYVRKYLWSRQGRLEIELIHYNT